MAIMENSICESIVKVLKLYRHYVLKYYNANCTINFDQLISINTNRDKKFRYKSLWRRQITSIKLKLTISNRYSFMPLSELLDTVS